MRALAILIFNLLIFSFAALKPAIAAIQFPVEKFKLANGLTVILQQDRTIPMVSYHTWYRVGSRNESTGVTGAAHMLEHMMFKGAKKYSGKEFDKVLHENGITNNAFTSWDYTGFYENLPSSKLELIMDMEVDRMRDLNLRQEDLTSELQVVGEERRWRVDNNPSGLLREALYQKIYDVHPYQWPVIGYMKDIQAYTPEKLRHFYDTYYLPNNAVLVLAGDFDIPSTKKMIEKYYGSLQARPIPTPNFPKESEPTKARRVEITSEVENSTVLIAYPSVESGHPDSWALDLLANVLGSGSSSRVFKKLVYKDQLATDASSYHMSNADPGVFVVSASVNPGGAVEPVKKILESEVEKVAKQKISTRELEKSKNILMKETLDGLTTIDGKAQSLAINEILYGDYRRLFSDFEKYQSVTVEDIHRVAQKYLKSSRSVTAVLNPSSNSKPSSKPNSQSKSKPEDNKSGVKK